MVSKKLRREHYCVFGWHHLEGEDCGCGCSFCKAARNDGEA